MLGKPRVLLVASAVFGAFGAEACGSSSSSSGSAASTPTTSASVPSTTTASAGAPSERIPRHVAVTGTKPLSGATVALLRRGPRAATGVKPRITPLQGLPVKSQLLSVANDVAAFWTNLANRSNVRLPPARVAVIGRTPLICNGRKITTNGLPGYCPANTTVYLPLASLTKLWAPIGNAALAEVVGESYGYHIAYEAGFYSKVSSNDLTRAGVCFSGAWMYTVYQRGLIQPGDIEAIGRLLTDYGSTKPGHLRVADFIKSFNTGYLSGVPGKCVPAKVKGR